ncbi:MAG: YifB family Mg chelatase-like AAA ATPase [Planctomycetota bacterium]
MPEKPVTIGSGVVHGVDSVPVAIEATLRGRTGPPKILGLVDTGIREAYHRILGAFVAQQLPSPRGTPTINFAPANLRKSGSGFDLPMALALAGAAGQFHHRQRLAAFGELSLRGEILPARGAVAVALALRDHGWPCLLTGPEDAAMAAMVPGLAVFAARTLGEALLWLRGKAPALPVPRMDRQPRPRLPDMADIRGHETPKTAVMVAAAGRHNLLMVGPPGSGKSALLRRLPALLPATSEAEALEILKVHTVHGVASPPLFGVRPIRAPHHTSSTVALLGGGADPRPGEVTLAHHGVLFLDELAEFRREALEGLRQPLEDGHITIGRARRVSTMPADFLLVGAMNPCPCGYRGHPRRACRCAPSQRQRYEARVSGPLLDRLDLQVEVPALDPSVLHQAPDTRWATAAMLDRVRLAIDRQQHRSRHGAGSGALCNGRLSDEQLEQAVKPSHKLRGVLEDVLRVHRLSGRARVRLLRIARTLADLGDRETVTPEDLVEAARLRGYERSQALG